MSTPSTPPQGTMGEIDPNNPQDFRYVYAVAYIHTKSAFVLAHPTIDTDLRLGQINYVCSGSAAEAQWFLLSGGREDRKEWLALCKAILEWQQEQNIGGWEASARLRCVVGFLEHHGLGEVEGRVQLDDVFLRGTGEDASGWARDGDA